MSIELWLSLLLVCCLGAITPGPSLNVILNVVTDNGRLHGIVASWSHAIGVGLYALLTISGLAYILQTYPIVFNILSWLGTIYLFYLGIKAFTSTHTNIDNKPDHAQNTLVSSAAKGGLISLLNPKLGLFFIALFSQFVLMVDSFIGKLILVLTPFLIDGLWYSLVSVFLSQSNILIKLRKHASHINKITGIIFILFAIKLAWHLLTE